MVFCLVSSPDLPQPVWCLGNPSGSPPTLAPCRVALGVLRSPRAWEDLGEDPHQRASITYTNNGLSEILNLEAFMWSLPETCFLMFT